VYLVDWSDTGECHENTGVHRHSGRIFRVTYQGDEGSGFRVQGSGGEDTARADAGAARSRRVADCDLVKLVALQEVKNEWLVRAARRELWDRAARGEDVSAAVEPLNKLLRHKDAVVRLRAAWALFGLNALPRDRVVSMLRDQDEHVRVWGVRLLTDEMPLDTATGQSRAEVETIDEQLREELVHRAFSDSSALVRLVLASTLQRLPIDERAKLASALWIRSEDADDHNLPALIWFGLIPLAERTPELLRSTAIYGQIPELRRWTARRYAELAEHRPELLVRLLADVVDTHAGTQAPLEARDDVALGAAEGLAGRRKVPQPASWPAFLASFSDPPGEVRKAVRALGVVFGDGRSLDEVRRLAFDDKAELDDRRAALRSLIDAQPPDLRETCEKLLKVRFLNTTALAGLARFDDPAIGRQLARSYRNFHPSERAAVIETLVSRPAFAAELLEQMAAGVIARSELSAAQARQIRSFDKPELTGRLAEVWGELRDSPQDKQRLIEQLKQALTPQRLTAANKAHGRELFTKSCATCHRLFGNGGEVGPDLTGANRKNLDYLLSNIVDPSAVVSKDYLMTVLALVDGRTINGVVLHETEAALTVQTAQAKETISRADIEERMLSKQSLMPDGLLQQLAPDDVADLFAYLMSERQVELAADGQR
ncbi:MAG TPA: c-type cytochrome, partial [Pirellulales bacterium]